MFNKCLVALPHEKYKSKDDMMLLKQYHTCNFPVDNTKICIFMHGSGGFSETSMKYINYMTSQGYTVFSPNCDTHKYNTTVQKACTANNQRLYRLVLQERLCELRKTVPYIHSTINDAHITLLGTSEGGIAVSRFRSKHKIKLKVICAYYPQRSYFTPHGPFMNTDNVEHTICIYGTKDEFFGPIDSITQQTKNMCKLSKTPIELPRFDTYVIKNGHHNILKTAQELVFAIIYSHLGAKQKRISPRFATLYFKIKG